jgi:hypothetical protein
MALQTASTLRSPALRKRCLSLPKSCSIGLRSGEYFGRKNSLAPTDRMARRTALPLRAEIVEDDDVARPKGRHEHLLDIEPEALAVDRPVDEPGRVDAIVAQRCEESHGLPAAVRDLGVEPLAARRPAPERRHIGLGPGFVDEDEAARIDPALIGGPLRAPSRHVGAIPLAGDQRLFLCVSRSAWTNSHTER